MVSLQNLFFITLSMFMITENILAEQNVITIKDSKTAPLALIRKQNSLSPALPEKYDLIYKEITFVYDDSEEEFETACAIPTDELSNVHTKWLNENIMSIGGSLLSTKRKDGEISLNCDVNALPSIKKTENKCAPSSKGVYYEVGYPVFSSDELGIEFVSMYKICYTSNRGTIYSIHHIGPANLDLLFRTIPTNSRPLSYYKSKIDDEVKYKQSQLKDGYLLQTLVVGNDMPIYLWQITTAFSFNSTPITEKHRLLEGITNFDNFIRLFGAQTQKQLTVYSGNYEYTRIDDPGCWGISRCSRKIPVKLFWRIITDVEKHAVIIITQHSPEKCDEGERLCNEHFLKLKNYPNQGCTYICSVNNETLELLDLPLLEITGYLELQFPKASVASNIIERSSPNKQSSQQQFVHISNFAEKSKFMDSVQAADSKLAQTMLAIIWYLE